MPEKDDMQQNSMFSNPCVNLALPFILLLTVLSGCTTCETNSIGLVDENATKTTPLFYSKMNYLICIVNNNSSNLIRIVKQ